MVENEPGSQAKERLSASQKALSKLEEGHILHKASHQKSAFILDKTNLSKKLMRIQSPTFDELLPKLEEFENFTNPPGTSRMEMGEEYVRFRLNNN